MTLSEYVVQVGILWYLPQIIIAFGNSLKTEYLSYTYTTLFVSKKEGRKDRCVCVRACAWMDKQIKDTEGKP